MNTLTTIPVLLSIMAARPVQFERHEIDSFPGVYQVAVADVDGDGRPDVIALSTTVDSVRWYRNPDWASRPIAETENNIDLAVRRVAGRLQIALASGFYFNDSGRGGQIDLLTQPDDLSRPWTSVPVAVDPVVHRLAWGDLDGDGRLELIHAPIFGPGSDAFRDARPSHLWAFRDAGDTQSGKWDVWKIDETLTVLHGLYVGDLNGDDRDEILAASYEGIFRFDFDARSQTWRKSHVAAGAEPVSDTPGAARGASEIVPGSAGPGRPFLAAIEPWHGNRVVVYTPDREKNSWVPVVLDESLDEGHALVVADFDGDGADEIVAGWRGAGGGLVLYDPVDDTGRTFDRIELDSGIAVEGAVAADISGNGRLDLVVAAGRTNNLTWYENRR